MQFKGNSPLSKESEYKLCLQTSNFKITHLSRIPEVSLLSFIVGANLSHLDKLPHFPFAGYCMVRSELNTKLQHGFEPWSASQASLWSLPGSLARAVPGKAAG